ncbi:MAG: ROK family protein [Gemmatimonadetes bacterium]|nr:ROK family protein [Gemmatimonadota bacterium]
MRFLVGVDIGGTNIVVGTVAEDGSAVFGVRADATRPEEGAPTVIRRIAQLVEESVTEAGRVAHVPRDRIVGVGIGSPGPLDRERGVVLLTPNLGWRNLPLRQLVSDAVGLPATLDNDANCAIYGVWWVGAARGSRYLVGITVGTGIGGGIVIEGQLYHGAADAAGEIGHATIDSTGRRCKCGNYGCLEAYASGPAIAARAIEGMEAGAETRLASYVGGDVSRITAQTVYEAAHDADAYALEVVRETAKFLGAGVANLINILNPDTFVIAGGVTLAGDHLFVPLRAEVNRRAFRPAVERCRIVPGELPGTAGVFGAAATFKTQTWGRV